MMIDKLNSVNMIGNLQNTKRTNNVSKSDTSDRLDSISVSEEAKMMAEEYYLKQIADETPDVRSELVASIKEKIKDPSYLSAATINATAERIMESYGI